jgi:hypothetical protein
MGVLLGEELLYDGQARSSLLLENSRQTLCTLITRIGLLPKLKVRASELSSMDGIVVLGDLRESGVSAEELEEYVRRGGKVWVAEGANAGSRNTHRFLSRCGLSLGAALEVSSLSIAAEGDSCIVEFKKPKMAQETDGGEPFLFAENGVPVGSLSRLGDGVVVVSAIDGLLSDVELGGCWTIPSDEQYAVYGLVFDVCTRILGVGSMRGM